MAKLKKNTMNEFGEVFNSSEQRLARASKKFLKTVKTLDEVDPLTTINVNQYKLDEIKRKKMRKYD